MIKLLMIALLLFPTASFADIFQQSGGTGIGEEVTDGTSTSVLFIDASGNLAEDPDFFNYNSSSGFLGVGKVASDATIDAVSKGSQPAGKFSGGNEFIYVGDTERAAYGGDGTRAFQFADGSQSALFSATGTTNAVSIINSNAALEVTGNADFKNGSTSSGLISIYEDSDAGSNKTTFQVPSLSADVTYTLPVNDGGSGEFLQTDGTGVLSWVASSSGTVDGTGTANYIPKWSDSNTLTDSIIFNGTNVGIGTITTPGRLSIWNPSASRSLNFFSSGYVYDDGIVGIDDNGNISTESNVSARNGFFSDNVGINSAAPGQVLDVQGTVRTTGFQMTTSPTNGYVLTSNATGVASWAAASGGSAAAGLGAVQYNSPVGTFAGREAVFSFNGTNVGIGTTNGLVLLDVRGTATFSNGANVGIGTRTPQAALVVTSGNVGIGTWTSPSSLTVVGGVGIGSVGNATTTTNIASGTLAVTTSVGIGTFAPPYPLSVFGSGYFSGNANQGVSIGTFTNGVKLEVVKNATDSWIPFAISSNVGLAAPGDLVVVDRGGNVGIGTVTPNVLLGVGLTNQFNVSSSGNVGIGTVRTATSALTVMSGNVGIGTWVPANLFQINKNASSPFAVSNLGNVGIGTVTPMGAFVVTNGNVGIGTWSPSNLFQIGNVANSLFLVKSDGNVGISSSNPLAKLDVQGTVKTTAFEMPTGASNGYLFTSDAAGKATWTAPGAGSGDVTAVGDCASGACFENSGAEETLTSASDELILRQTGDSLGASNIRVQNRTGSNGAIVINEAVDLADIALQGSTGAQSNLRFEHRSGSLRNAANTTNGELQWIDNAAGTPVVTFFHGRDASGFSQGDLGVNTESPAARLHVIDFDEPLRLGYDGSNYFSTVISNDGTTTFNAVGSGSKFVFSDNIEGVGATFSSNVGIGSATPGKQLDVQGTVRSTTFTDGTAILTGGVLTLTSVNGMIPVTPGTNPTINANGKFSEDTSSGSGNMWKFGANGAVLPAYYTKSFAITSATSAGDFGNVWRTPLAITLKAVHCLAVGGTNVVGQLQECDANGANCTDVDSDMTCTAGSNVNDDGSLSNATLDATDYLGVKTTSVSGTNTNITWTFEYTVDAVN